MTTEPVLSREIEAGKHRRAGEPDPLDIGEYCSGCMEDWPCPYVRGVSAERARIAEEIQVLPTHEFIDCYECGTTWLAVDRADVLRVVEEDDR